MKRVMIFGSAGSGKSTLARAIGARLGLAVIHLDGFFWKPGWIESTPEEFAAMHDAAVVGERWIMDGGYSRTFARRIAAADTIVLFDLPRRTCLVGIFRRWLKHRGRTRLDLAAGCPEKLDWTFLKFVWNYRAQNSAKQVALVESLRATKDVLVFRTRRDAYRWLESLPEATT